ncbi:biofilm development regulator YmgB/AriR family protein [Yersinia intermedia]|uniref:biofilm development regulator YmgB/AriR family protein n=1 Tax=Yersinia intermedia TaxID=631 RepID=UPI0022FE389A|nr:biofilm development regulator YmgB/AriR family protein [Yersinia intermedia]MDA5514409.1 biofilm development regulator YmgB/AriR family protein [Yersinia intermedia]
MEQKSSTADQIDDYFRVMNEGTLGEKEAFPHLFAELASLHKTICHKDIIRELVRKLETEQDVIKADIYRNMLEMMHQPPHKVRRKDSFVNR